MFNNKGSKMTKRLPNGHAVRPNAKFAQLMKNAAKMADEAEQNSNYKIGSSGSEQRHHLDQLEGPYKADDVD